MQDRFETTMKRASSSSNNSTAVVESTKSTAEMLANMRDTRGGSAGTSLTGGVPVTIVIEPENDCYAEESDEELEEDDHVAQSASSSICSGVYFNNAAINAVSSLQHPLQTRPVLIGGQSLKGNVPNGRPLPCPPKLVILGSNIVPRNRHLRGPCASHRDYRKLSVDSPVLQSTSPPTPSRKRLKLTSQSHIVVQEPTSSSSPVLKSQPVLSAEQLMFVEAATALKEADSIPPPPTSESSSVAATRTTRLPVTNSVLPPPPFKLPDSVMIIKPLSLSRNT